MDKEHQFLEPPMRQAYERLYLERKRLMGRRVALLAELRSLSQIKCCYDGVVRGRYEGKSESTPSAARLRQDNRVFYELFEDLYSEITEIRLELEHNRAELNALRSSA